MHWGGIILLLLSVKSISAEVYDVTTIYRTVGSITPIAEINQYDNYSLVCDDICPWEKNGWRRYEAMSDKNITELDGTSGKLYFPLASQKFGISFSRPNNEEVQRFFIYLLPEDNINAVDLKMIVLTYGLNGSYSEVFECTDDENRDTSSYHAVELPNGNTRQCQTLVGQKVIPSMWNLNIYFTVYNYIKIYMQGEDSTNLEDLYTIDPENLAFIAINSTTSTTFVVKPIYRFTKLSKLTGTLRSPYLFTKGLSKGYATCITISYYLKTASNISLQVYVEQRNGRMIEIGAVNMKGQQEGISKVHQFIWYSTDAIVDGFQYTIKGTKNSEDDIVLIKKISGCHNVGFTNLTTVQKQGSIEVQARNNALGLPIHSSQNVTFSHNIESIFDECFVGNVCQWNSVNWIKNYELNVSLIPSGISSINSEEWAYESSVTPTSDFTGYFEINFTPKEAYYYYLDIILLNSTADTRLSDLFVIRLADTNNIYKYIYRCFNSRLDQSAYDIVVDGHSRKCEQLFQSNYYYNLIANQNIVLNKKESTVTITGISDTISRDLEGISNMTKVCFAASKAGNFTLTQGLEVWTLSSATGTLRSPSFLSSEFDNICVSVTYYMCDTCELQLRLESLDENILDIGNFSTRNTWTTERKILKLPKQHKELMTQIVLHGENSNGNKMLVQRIGGCDPEEKVDIVLVFNGETLNINENVYKAAIRRSSQAVTISLPDNQCKNGGVFDAVNQGCVCPAGFGGSTCEIGCGVNAFGANCDVICSGNLKGCKEMFFCREKLGCNCAAGLQGALCSSTCDPGYYGAGCTEKCGNCKYGNSTCNIYTGYCYLGCLEGYYPPFCKEYYKHFTMAPEATEIDSESATIRVNFANTSGKGKPTFYQLQYIEADQLQDENPVWLELEPLLAPVCEEMECLVTENITDLKQGKAYKIRAVLLDQDGNSYQGQNIPQLTLTTTTNCIVPKKLDYKLRAEYVTESSFHIFWEYTPESNWCSLKTFEVEFRENSRWIPYYRGTEQNTVFTDMWYGMAYKIRVVAITVAGAAAYSDILVVKTKEEAPHEVLEIKITSVASKSLTLEWVPPLLTGGLIKYYKITFKCVKLLGCREEDCSYFTGELRSLSTSITIGNLLPFAQYSISVAAYTSTLGSAKHMLAATAIAEPEVTPGSDFNPVSSSTNTSITVQWKPPRNCSRINGFLHGYLYELVQDPQAGLPISVLSNITNATFLNLIPLTEYTVKVFVVNSAGWNPQYPLVISAIARTTTPDMVRNLTVYKQSRRMIGFRWSYPKQPYVELESFTVSYQMNSPGSRPLTVVVKPTPCAAWPELYCHMFAQLQPDKQYIISVSVRNNEVDEDGEPLTVTALTKERAPAEPSYLNVIEVTETSITLEWGLPYMVNGLLRSFLLSVEGTDSHNYNECCQYLPLQEVAVLKEEPSYQYKVSGLLPSSTYSVSVSGKTVSLGSAVSISAHTRPSLPVLDDIIKLGSEPVSKNMPVIIKPVMENKDLVSAYLLIVVLESAKQVPVSIIRDKWLNETITEDLDYTYYVAGEYTQDDLEEYPEVLIGTGSVMHVKKLSTTQDPELWKNANYSLAVAVVLDYCGVKNVGISTTPTFRIRA